MSCCCPFWQQYIIAQDMGDPCCDAFCLMLCAPAALFALRAHMRGKENIRNTKPQDDPLKLKFLDGIGTIKALAHVLHT
ncbi:hypothetical protein Btru_060381 [Bulinus truncatus]|nr:hypothetical protein Btru_060381 [Bulinus truncatus]